MTYSLTMDALDIEAGDKFTTAAGDQLTALQLPEPDPHDALGMRSYRMLCRDSNGETIYWLFKHDDEVTVHDDSRRYDDNDEDWQAKELGK